MFSIIGNMNSVNLKSFFPLIQKNKVWLGYSISSGDREFRVPENYPLNAAGSRIDDEGNKYVRVKGVRWFTNIPHGKRHEPLSLMTKADNERFNKKIIKNPDSYRKYDNYDAIEVPSTNAIPSDYKGTMGVPITFLDKFCPEQFEIVSMYKNGKEIIAPGLDGWHIDGKRKYARIFIKHKNPESSPENPS